MFANKKTMAKYNLGTETTVHVKGMSLGESLEGIPSMGGEDNWVEVNNKKSRVGYYNSNIGIISVIDSDEFFYLYGQKYFSSIYLFLNIILDLKDSFGMDVSDYVEQLGYPGFIVDFAEQYFNFHQGKNFFTDIEDVWSITNYDKWDAPVSKGFLPYFLALTLILEGLDDRSFDEIVADFSANVESNINWDSSMSDVDFHFIFPRINKEGAVNLLRTYCELHKSQPSSARTMSLLRR